jgi:MFS family permease
MLTIMTLAYTGQPAEALRTRGALVERRQSLFATYVNRMFQRRSAVTRYTHQQTERWLAWLAWQLTQHSQTTFSLERLQPDWLPVGRRWLPTHGAQLLAGLVGLLGGLPVGLFVGLVYQLEAAIGAVLIGAVTGAFIGGLTGYAAEITPIETVRWSWPKFLSELLLPSRRGLRGGLLGGLLAGLLGGLTSGPVTGAQHGLLTGLVDGLLTGLTIACGIILISGLGAGLGVGLLAGLLTGLDVRLLTWLKSRLFFELLEELKSVLSVGLPLGLGAGLVYKLSTGLTAGLSGGEITMKTLPNEGIYRSARMAVASGLVSGLGVGLLVGLPFGLFAGLHRRPGLGLGVRLICVLASGPLVGLAAGLRYGGRACLQHLVLRLGLRYYDCMPRRYADFLDYAAERLFLRRVGSGYIFIHRLLQDHFATRYQSDHVDSPPQP